MFAHINSNDCLSCGACVDVCPNQIIEMGDTARINPAKVGSNLCDGKHCSSECMATCPAGAITEG